MAASNGIITNHAMGTMSIYFPAGGTVGTYCPISKSQIALSTDSIEFIPEQNGRFQHITCISTMTGTLQLEENGDMKPYFIDLAEHQNDLTIVGGADIGIPYFKGRKYRFKVVVQLAA